MSHATTDQLWIFGFRPINERLRGKPKQLRIERQVSLNDETTEETPAYLEEIVDYLPSGAISQRRIFGPDGKVTYKFIHDYDETNRLSKVRCLDSSDREHRTEIYLYGASGTTERLTIDETGSELERTVSIAGATGNVLETTSIDLITNQKIVLSIQYDDHDRPADAELRFELNGQLIRRAEITFTEDHQKLTWKGPDGSVLHALQSSISGADLVYSVSSLPSEATVRREEVVERDSFENWTMKIIDDSQNDSQQSHPTAILRRSILYYSDDSH